MPPRRDDYERNRDEERTDLEAYEQPFTEKAGVFHEMIVDMRYVRRDVQQIKDSLAKNYVTQDQFDPIKRLVYGTVTVVLTALIGAGMALLLR